MLQRFKRAIAELTRPMPRMPEREEPVFIQPRPTRWAEAAGVTVDADDHLYRALSSDDTKRDLTPVSQKRMIDLAAYQWESNPLIKAMINLPVAFLLGEGVALTVDDPEAQVWLDEFWRDPITNMDLNLEKHVRELSLFGEQCWPVIVHPISGHVRLAKIDPAAIEHVIADPQNASALIGVTVLGRNGKRKKFRIIYDGDDRALFGEAAQKMRAAMTDGDCFFWRINELGNGKRGRSDILSTIDHADTYEQIIFGEAERTIISRMVSWDVTLKNATPDMVKERAAQIRPPEPLSVRVHNEGEEWKQESPTLNASETSEALRTLRNHVSGGSTIPEHWFGGGGDVNLATANSMGEPTFKVFSQRQRLLKGILEAVARYVIRQRLLAISSEIVGFAKMPTFQPTANFPELTARDVAKHAAALQQVVVGVVQAVASGVMSEETAVSLIAIVAVQLGLEIDAAKELAAARADAMRRASEDVYRDPLTPVPEQTPAPAREADQ